MNTVLTPICMVESCRNASEACACLTSINSFTLIQQRFLQLCKSSLASHISSDIAYCLIVSGTHYIERFRGFDVIDIMAHLKALSV